MCSGPVEVDGSRQEPDRTNGSNLSQTEHGQSMHSLAISVRGAMCCAPPRPLKLAGLMRVYQFTGEREPCVYVPEGICVGTVGTMGERWSRAAANVVARGYAGRSLRSGVVMQDLKGVSVAKVRRDAPRRSKSSGRKQVGEQNHNSIPRDCPSRARGQGTPRLSIDVVLREGPRSQDFRGRQCKSCASRLRAICVSGLHPTLALASPPRSSGCVSSPKPSPSPHLHLLHRDAARPAKRPLPCVF
jgi:hypothetical protein